MYFFLGDSAYPSTTRLLTPYANAVNDYEKKYNQVHKTLRVKIENSFGLLKGQWRRLLNLNVNSIDRANKIIESCILLHNFNIRYNQNSPLNPQRQPVATNDTPIEVDSTEAGRQKRDAIARSLLDLAD